MKTNDASFKQSMINRTGYEVYIGDFSAQYSLIAAPGTAIMSTTDISRTGIIIDC